MKTIVIILPITKGDRKELEDIENGTFHSLDAIRDEFNSDEVGLYELSEFMDACNNTDDDTPKHLKIDLMENWIGYVQLKTNK